MDKSCDDLSAASRTQTSEVTCCGSGFAHVDRNRSIVKIHHRRQQFSTVTTFNSLSFTQTQSNDDLGSIHSRCVEVVTTPNQVPCRWIRRRRRRRHRSRHHQMNWQNITLEFLCRRTVNVTTITMFTGAIMTRQQPHLVCSRTVY